MYLHVPCFVIYQACKYTSEQVLPFWAATGALLMLDRSFSYAATNRGVQWPYRSSAALCLKTKSRYWHAIICTPVSTHLKTKHRGHGDAFCRTLQQYSICCPHLYYLGCHQHKKKNKTDDKNMAVVKELTITKRQIHTQKNVSKQSARKRKCKS